MWSTLYGEKEGEGEEERGRGEGKRRDHCKQAYIGKLGSLYT